uniref:Uncharacterized protein n=1 Tax=Plectus sambesii TaxID=2011161 RepID=A0A914XCC1_9BILA
MPCNLTEPHQILGSLYIAHGGTYLILYLPSLIVIFKKQLYKMSCYKIMIFMGLLDVLNLCSNALLAGYYSIIGRNYCEGDKFMPSIGAAALGMWAAYCASCVLLGFNRYIDLRSQHLSSILFDGKRLYLWLAVPVSYGLFFASPALPPVGYSADLGVWFIMGDSLFHSINNFLTCSLLIALYILIVGLLWRKMRANSSHNVSVMQKQIGTLNSTNQHVGNKDIEGLPVPKDIDSNNFAAVLDTDNMFAGQDTDNLLAEQGIDRKDKLGRNLAAAGSTTLALMPHIDRHIEKR